MSQSVIDPVGQSVSRSVFVSQSVWFTYIFQGHVITYNINFLFIFLSKSVLVHMLLMESIGWVWATAISLLTSSYRWWSSTETIHYLWHFLFVCVWPFLLCISLCSIISISIVIINIIINSFLNVLDVFSKSS